MPRLTHLIKAEVKHVPEYTSSLLESRYSFVQGSTGLVCYCRKYTSRMAKLWGDLVPYACLYSHHTSPVPHSSDPGLLVWGSLVDSPCSLSTGSPGGSGELGAFVSPISLTLLLG